jgi:hypothetical protein
MSESEFPASFPKEDSFPAVVTVPSNRPTEERVPAVDGPAVDYSNNTIDTFIVFFQILLLVIAFYSLLTCCLKCFKAGTAGLKSHVATTVVYMIKLAALLICHHVLLTYYLKPETDAKTLFNAMCILAWALPLVNLLLWAKKKKKKLPESPIRLQGNDIYEDFTIPTFRALVLGFTQCGLIMFYVDGMQKKLVQFHVEFESEDGWFATCDLNEEGCDIYVNLVFYYWVGVFVQLGFFIGNDSWGSVTSSVDFWASILKLMKGSKDLRWSPEPELPDSYWLRAFELSTRSFFSLAINPAALGFIVLALPFQVAVGKPGDPEVDPLDFVLNVVAAFVIIDIDNLAVPRLYDVTIVEKADEQSECSEEHQSETPIDHTGTETRSETFSSDVPFSLPAGPSSEEHHQSETPF